jgi:Ras-related protein Rab-28
LASRYCHDEFTRQYFPTAGVDFFLKRTVLSGAGNITLQIWDVGGQSLAGNMLDKYIFGAHVSREHSIIVIDRS